MRDGHFGRGNRVLLVALIATSLSMAAVDPPVHAQRSTPVDSIGARTCEWDGWLPPNAARARYRAAHPLNEPAEQSLRLLLDSPKAQERDRAARALAAGRDSATVTALLDHVTDPNSVVRDGVVRSLGRIGAARAVSALVMVLSGSDPHLRQAAAWSLGQLEAVRARDALLAASHDTNEHVRSEAAWALGFAGDESTVPRLRQMTTDERKAVRLAAVCAIGWLRGAVGDAVSTDTSEVVRGATAWVRGRSRKLR